MMRGAFERNTLFSMRYSHLVACSLLLGLVASCGGSPPGPQSERNDYGRTVAEMQAAPTSVSSVSGPVTLEAVGNESRGYIAGTPRWTVDPFTGRVDFEQGELTSFPNWFFALALKDSSGQRVATEWNFTTVWVLQGNDFVSSRTLFTKDSKLFIVGYPNPPFSTESTKAVVELTRGSETQLISTTVIWPQ